MTKMQNTYYKTIVGKIAEFRKLGFDDDQMEELRLGLEHGVPVSAYAKKEYFAVQMRQIRFGLEEGLDISLYNDEKYDWFQMEEIRMGLKEGIDASIYADPKYSYEVMRELRKALKDGIHLEKYAAVGAEMLRELHRALLDKQNIMPYIKSGYVPEQLQEIRHAMKLGCNIDPYLNPVYRGSAIREITEGLEEGLDVSVYADPDYSWQQMREIRLGMEKGLDISLYSKNLYSWQQMREIRLGLEEGLDVEAYKSMMHSAFDMKKIRQKLLQEAEKEGETELSDTHTAETLPENVEEYLQKLPADTIHFFVDEDKMKAYVYAGKAVLPMSKEDLAAQLTMHKIIKGLDVSVVNHLLSGSIKDQLVVIANGQEAVDGTDGYYESFIGETDYGIRTQKDGSLDFTNAYLFQKVYAGQKLLVYHNATAGTDGFYVDGKKIHAVDGKEAPRIRGRGFRLLEDSHTYLAEENGCVAFHEHNLSVTKMLELETADNILGDVDYDGAVYIKGDVDGNIRIRAAADIVVEGFLGNATLESEGNILIKKGANGNGEAHITASHMVLGRFFENVDIHAEQIVSNYFFRSRLYADKKIEVKGNNGSIAGGNVYAGYGIGVSTVGNCNGIETFIRVGYDKDKEGDDYYEQSGEVEKQIAILCNSLKDYRKNYAPEIRNTMPIFLKLENALYTKEKELTELKKKAEQQKIESKKYESAYLEVYGSLYEGTTVVINDAVYQGETIQGVLLKNIAGRMSVQQTKEKIIL